MLVIGPFDSTARTSEKWRVASDEWRVLISACCLDEPGARLRDDALVIMGVSPLTKTASKLLSAGDRS